jgi:hypothetical protein
VDVGGVNAVQGIAEFMVKLRATDNGDVVAWPLMFFV